MESSTACHPTTHRGFQGQAERSGCLCRSQPGRSKFGTIITSRDTVSGGYSMRRERTTWPFPAESGTVSWCPARGNMWKRDLIAVLLSEVQDFMVLTLAVLGLLARGWSGERHDDPNIVGIHVLPNLQEGAERVIFWRINDLELFVIYTYIIMYNICIYIYILYIYIYNIDDVLTMYR